jgi:hypothetical protein
MPSHLPSYHLYTTSIFRRATSLYELPRVISTVTRVKSIQCQLSPKMTKMSDMCHLLVTPRQHDDAILMHADVSIEFGLVDLLPIWINEQNAISGEYGVRLSSFKFCWVYVDEDYAHVRFEAILRTLIFRPL